MKYICSRCESDDAYQQRLADAQRDWVNKDREYEISNGLPLTPWTWHHMGTGEVAAYDCGSAQRCLREDY